MGSPLGGQLEAQCPATVQREEVLRALAAERDGSVGHHLPEPVEAGIAHLAGASFADPHVGPQVVQSSQHAFVGPRRDLYGQRSPGGTCDGRSGQGGVATRCDGQWRGRRDPVELQVEGQAEQVPGLVAARHVAGLVLRPDAARLANGITQGGQVSVGGGLEAAAVHVGDGVVQPADQVHVPGVRPAGGHRCVVRPEQGPEGDERVGVVGQWIRRPRPGGTRRAAQPADPGVGSVGRGAVHRPAGGRCAQPAAGTPARPLNSSIMASHVGAMVWTWRQKSCPRRTSKSAKSIPRCSTHV